VSLPDAVEAILPLALAEQHYIEHTIALCGGNLHLAARTLGISPSEIYGKRENWTQDA
jgi:two-component system repressor protein LuxO